MYCTPRVLHSLTITWQSLSSVHTRLCCQSPKHAASCWSKNKLFVSKIIVIMKTTLTINSQWIYYPFTPSITISETITTMTRESVIAKTRTIDDFDEQPSINWKSVGRNCLVSYWYNIWLLGDYNQGLLLQDSVRWISWSDSHENKRNPPVLETSILFRRFSHLTIIISIYIWLLQQHWLFDILRLLTRFHASPRFSLITRGDQSLRWPGEACTLVMMISIVIFRQCHCFGSTNPCRWISGKSLALSPVHWFL